MQDYRNQSYVKHKLIDIIAISIASIICVAQDWYEIVDYGEKKYSWLKTFLELPHGVPSHDTYTGYTLPIVLIYLVPCALITTENSGLLKGIPPL